MTTHRVRFQPYDIFHRSIDDAKQEVSFDQGATWRPLSSRELQDGLSIKEGQPFVARVSKPGLWPVVQPLIVRDGSSSLPANDGSPVPSLDFDGQKDYGAWSFFSHDNGPGSWMHVVHVALTLFRNAAEDRVQHGLAPTLPDWRWSVLSFDGQRVLSGRGKGFERFAASLADDVPSWRPNGTVAFAKTPKGARWGKHRLPELVVIFTPTGLDLTKPLPIHTFFTPQTDKKRGDYPHSTSPDGFSAMVDNYLVSPGKRLLNQHAASKKSCICAFPVAPPGDYFQAIQTGPELRRYLLEIAYWLRRERDPFEFANPGLGYCAVSGFSAAGGVLAALLPSCGAGAFDELREAYCLDAFPGDTEAAFRALSSVISSWWSNGAKGRRVRMYSKYGFHREAANRPDFAKSGTVSADGTLEVTSPTATFAYTSLAFWQRVQQENAGSTKARYFPTTKDEDTGVERERPLDYDDLHQLMPAVFLEHALRNSGFSDV